MASSSATATAYVPPQDKYDVFLSFRGPDTREGFTNYLYEALERKQIKTFIDDRIEKGDGITKALEEAIEQSRISIIVFSEKYATSRWCLDELVHILDCEEKYGRVVKHVFYKISPSEVRNPAEGCYAKAFESYEKEERFKDRVPIWKDALSTAANKSGFNSAKHEIEAKLIEEIVNDVLVRLNRNSPIIVPGLVGVKSQIEQIESLLCIEAQHVKFRLVGIWGMGGIGKTTLADAVYHRLSSKFEGCAFISNVREQSEKQGIHHVRNELFHKLIMDESISIDSPSIGSRSVLDRLSRTKALVVLDDVNESEQLEYLLGQQVVFGRGSRVIITSRDRRPLIERVDDDHIYKVVALNDDDALELFHSKASNDGAFKISNPDLLKEVASYAKGVPLLLKVLGSSFRHCNSGKDCEDRLKILKMCPDKKSQDLLRVGYSGLGEYVKGIFLDIACFFKGEKRHDAERLIELHGFYAPAQGISVLVDMSLVSISMDDRLEMHDLLQEMGMAIVREQCVSDPGRRTRLWSAEDVYRVSKYNTGTPIVEGMLFDISEIQGRQLSRTTFTNMHNLRLLKCYVSNYSVNALDLPQGLETLPESLRYVYWYRYCLDSLPLEFLPCNLVELRMPFSRIKKLWSNGKNLGSLKVIDLSSSYGLCEVPDLSQSRNIEEINLSWCSNLVEIPPYFKNLHKLASLKLNYCGKLETFPDEMPCNLRFLDLSRCTHLTKVPDISGCANIEEIDLSGTRLVEIPLYFQHLDKLRSLNLGDCLIEYIPQLPCNLEKLFLYNCTCLKKLAKGNYRLNRLETLNLLSCWALEKLPPFSVGLRSLRELILSNCKSLEIPAGLICLSSLHTVHLEKSLIESIPGNIKYASGLRILNIANCMKLRSLPELPPLVEKLDASGCTSLQRVASSRTTVQQYEDPYYRKELLNFVDCLYLNGSSRSNIMSDAQCRIMQMASSKVHKTRQPNGSAGEDSFTVCYPGNYMPEWFCSYRGKGCSVEFEFSPDWSTDFLGFALCAVVAGENSYGDDARFIYKTNNGECYRDQNFGTDGICSKTRKDYVVWYFTKLEHSTYGGRRPIPFNEVTNASFHFYSGGKLKACGIRLLYAHNAVGSSCRPYKVVTTVYSEMATAASNGSGTGTVTVTAKRKPVFIKVEEIQPGTSGHTLTVKVVRSNPVTSKYGGAPSSRPLQPPRIAECLVGDETGTIVFTARKDQVDIMKPGTTVILRNAKIDMFKGTMRLAVDKWGRVEVTEPASFEVMETNNLSLVEYELV